MRFLLTIFLFAFFFKTASAQDTLSYATFSETQYSAWKNIEQKWLTEKYYPFLKKEKIKLSCASCTSASAWVCFSRANAVTTFKILENKKCGQPFKGKQLTELKKLVGEIKLPPEFDNTRIKVLLGLTLKC
jgi:hypothetical protein